MQDIHLVGGGGGHLFGGGGDRRLRPHQNQNHNALKCPRCESLNTKFCYYNNYNLSQPRHFCKSCRRYWTKGGVLRNVPVGGGCRKSKRSKPKLASDAPRERKSSSHSSSESSSLTATTTAAAAATTTAATATTEVASASTSTSASTLLLNFPDSRFFIPQAAKPTFDPPLIDQSSDGGIFPDIGSFTSLMTSSNDSSLLGFNIADISSCRFQHYNDAHVLQHQCSNQQWHQELKMTSTAENDELKMQEMTAGFLDQAAQNELSGLHNRESNDGLPALDWQAGGDQSIFDLTGTVDQTYWSQTRWSEDNRPFNYLP